MSLTPCPSPNGTNFERLYIVRKPARMAMDAALSPPSNYVPDDNNGDLTDKIYELLAGKLSPGDLEALVRLIQGDEPAPVQDRRRPGLAHDELRRHVAAGLARRAQATTDGLLKRFPDLKNARVVG